MSKSDRTIFDKGVKRLPLFSLVYKEDALEITGKELQWCAKCKCFTLHDILLGDSVVAKVCRACAVPKPMQEGSIYLFGGE